MLINIYRNNIWVKLAFNPMLDVRLSALQIRCKLTISYAVISPDKQ